MSIYILKSANRNFFYSVTSILGTDGTDYGLTKEFGYLPNQFWVIKTSKVIPEGATVKLSIQFDGSLSKGIVGFYKAFYANGTK